MIDGLSESLWKSVVVKSQRIGWVAGLQQAALRLSPSTMRSLLTCGLFEDTYPPREEFDEALREAYDFEFEKLCARETHHGRGMTPEFCRLETVAMRAMNEKRTWLYAEGRKLGRTFMENGLWLPPRSLNCVYTWLVMKPGDTGVRREPDRTPWTGVPAVMADMHTPEGRGLGTYTTLLSGSYEQHLRLYERYARDEGWGSIREEVHRKLMSEVVPDRSWQSYEKRKKAVKALSEQGDEDGELLIDRAREKARTYRDWQEGFGGYDERGDPPSSGDERQARMF
jgi:hypothetical protein